MRAIRWMARPSLPFLRRLCPLSWTRCCGPRTLGPRRRLSKRRDTMAEYTPFRPPPLKNRRQIKLLDDCCVVQGPNSARLTYITRVDYKKRLTRKRMYPKGPPRIRGQNALRNGDTKLSPAERLLRPPMFCRALRRLSTRMQIPSRKPQGRAARRPGRIEGLDQLRCRGRRTCQVLPAEKKQSA